MFTLSNPYTHVTSAAFAQAWLKPGSVKLRSAQVCSGLFTLFMRVGAVETKKSSTLPDALEKSLLLQPGISNM
jgi:hypothetical protein